LVAIVVRGRIVTMGWVASVFGSTGRMPCVAARHGRESKRKASGERMVDIDVVPSNTADSALDTWRWAEGLAQFHCSMDSCGRGL